MKDYIIRKDKINISISELKFKKENEKLKLKNKELKEKFSLYGVSQQRELLAFEDWVNKNTTTALKDGIKLALENYKKANCCQRDCVWCVALKWTNL